MNAPTLPPCPPVLLVVFKRPDTTREVMAAIRAARPARLYVAADGPRPGRAGEAEACAATRAAATEVDWPCEVATLLRDANVGCRRGVSTAIDWFLEREPEGVVLEDDVVPAPSFFPYCAELLARYRDDARVSMIGGTNFQGGVRRGDASYYFSRMHHVWGWATWRRAWRRYDRDMALWDGFKRADGFRQLGLDGTFARFFTPYFEAVAAGRIDTWDYQWVFSALAHNMFAVIPQENLVTNIGFRADASHTKDAAAQQSRMAVGEIAFPLRHPDRFHVSLDADLATIASQLPPPLHRRALAAVARRLR